MNIILELPVYEPIEPVEPVVITEFLSFLKQIILNDIED